LTLSLGLDKLNDVMRFIIRILANALAIYLAAYFIQGVTVSGDWKIFLLCGLVLSLINMIAKPILKLISLPLLLITFGLFSLVINILTIWLLTKFVSQLAITGLTAFIFTTIIVSIVNWLVSFLYKKKTQNHD
jgi:putative membrane protein